MKDQDAEPLAQNNDGALADEIGEGGDILSAPRNCRSVSAIDRSVLLVDGAAYFGQLDTCLQSAQRSVVVVGWDFDADLRLRPRPDGSGETLGARLRSLVDARAYLTVHILVWSLAVAHGPSRAVPLLAGEAWQDHPRIHVRLATDHPIYASHHQKIVVIDGAVGFVGGIDLTVGRWDTTRHPPEEVRRKEADGSPGRPVHDCQLMVTGPIINDLVDVAKQRWRGATGETLDVAACAKAFDWPKALPVDLHALPAGVATTEPAYRSRPEVTQSARLLVDMMRSARRSIYVECQYFAGQIPRQVLAERLAEPDGPDVVIVTSLTMNGVVEQASNGRNRDRLLRHLKRHDRFGRLRACYPAHCGDDGTTEIFVHAKLVIIDNRFLRVGSANLNNRSVGVDTECEIGIEARNSADRAAIESVRARLLAEHLGVSEADILRTCEVTGSLAKAIDRLNGGQRSLLPFAASEKPGSSRPVLGTRLLDPIAPYGTKTWWRGRRSF